LPSVKSFVSKIKQKNAEFKEKQEEKKAQSKGFSSAKAYNFYSNTAKTEGEEIAKSELRKKELKRIKDEAKAEVISGKTGKYNKYQKKVQKGFESFQKGAGIYNEMMGGLQSLGSGGDSFYPKQNSNQSYASGYGLFPSPKPKRRKSTTKKTKRNQKSKSKPKSFWDDFY